ncbi:MAG: TonB family protein, partial [Bacteroidaceae bacterium]|nr:TonB family protein [Bacteroidaceae bacterium]
MAKRLFSIFVATAVCGIATAGNWHEVIQADSVVKKLQFKKESLDTQAKGGIELKKNDTELRSVANQNKGKSEKRASARELKERAISESKKKGSTNNKKPDDSSLPEFSYPTYPGGNVAIRSFIKKEQRYPEECKRERLRGRVEVTATIAPDGTIHDIGISESSGNEHMDAEALRVAYLVPRWTPAAKSKD